MNDNQRHIIIMGVSGSGKSTIGKLLSQRIQLPFRDADDYHPEANIRKMAAGKPLEDQDRIAWLWQLNRLLRENQDTGLIMACSALKEDYRKILCDQVDIEFIWIYLKGSFEEILERLRARKEHFMPSTLLQSQFDTLEVPSYAVVVNIGQTPEEIVGQITDQLDPSTPS